MVPTNTAKLSDNQDELVGDDGDSIPVGRVPVR